MRRAGSVRLFLQEDSWIEPGYRAVVGYKGFGAVGIITVLHLVEELGMDRVGIVVSRHHPEYAFRGGRGLVYPYEIYVDRQKKILAVATRELPDERIRVDYVWEITRFLKKLGVETLYLIGGLDSRLKRGPEDQLRWLANRYYRGPVPRDPEFERGLLIIGPLALQLMFADILEVPTLALLPYAKTDAPDPAAAAIAIDRLNSLLGISVEVDELLAEAARIQEELSRLEEAVSREASERKSSEPYM